MTSTTVVFGLMSLAWTILLLRQRDLIRWCKWVANGDPEGRFDTPGLRLFFRIVLSMGAVGTFVCFLTSLLVHTV
ncbi:MAG: hypothetical protein HY874_07535 [Chloroflexi bacterium]|nr:hypothetical protein [Chloroflexota bacterium]